MIEITKMEDLENLNTSELAAHAKWMGIPGAHRGVPRDVLIRAIWGNEAIPGMNPVDTTRDKFSAYLRSHWAVFRIQKYSDQCPDCYLCRDIQSIDCLLKNKRGMI